MLAIGLGVEWDPQTAEQIQFLAVGFERLQLDSHVPVSPRLLRNPQRGGKTAAPEEGVEARGQGPASGLGLTFVIQKTVEERQAHDGQGALARAAEKESAIELHRVLLLFECYFF